MTPELNEESRKLDASWSRHDDAMLRDYLVGGVQDPWLNPQSIQARHFVIEAICGRPFPGLFEEEIRFAEAMRWMWRGGKADGDTDWFEVLEHALGRGADDAEGTEIPARLLLDYRRLPGEIDGVTVPNYLSHGCQSGRDGGALELAKRGFAPIWRHVLRQAPSRRWTVLEPACGSANDVRVWSEFGLEPHVEYHGFDLCPRNVANARALCPAAHFEVGNAFEIARADASVDLVIVHDLFEHLSMAGLDAALSEVARVTRSGLFVGFFQMHEEDEHFVHPVEEYHVNRLSLPRVRGDLERRGFRTRALHVDSWMRSFLGGREPFYEEWAYNLTAVRG